MSGLKILMDMIATEAVEGGARDHYFDEFRNREYIPPEPETYSQSKTRLPPIRFNLELIKKPNGSYQWVE